MNSLHLLHAKLIAAIRDLGLLALRIFAGQEFLVAGYTKLSGGIHAPEWFSGLQFPFPLGLLGADINWVMAGTGEIVFGLALLVGLYGRLAALGLLFITYVAIYTVHFDLGWSGWNQIDTEAGLGFKVPLMLGLMLFTILTQGSGRYSITK
ncbi:DoxX family protein [Methylophilus sp. Leaf408]|uniref:DoxX family protein n=1 Tax=Methylophilus sp. Leaf408 TaxID=2876561 RepID=UPI001E49E6AE|nr:DoxX family protein [Methylophilus sp. Leaf408]